MAPAFAIPRLLARHGLGYADVDLWEIHEAFAAQLLFHIKALEDGELVRYKAGVQADLGTTFPREPRESERRQRRAWSPLRRNRGAHPESSRKGAERTAGFRIGYADRQHLHRRGSGRRGAVAVG